MSDTLQTPWIDAKGAERILVELGILEPEERIPDIAIRDRPTYLYGLLYEIAYAITTKSANPAAMAPGKSNATARGYADRRLMSWASRSARSLDAMLDAL